MADREDPARTGLASAEQRDLAARIEKPDFPVVRRGYSPAAVDAHLRAVASDVEELRRAGAGQDAESLASTAGAQVRSIIEAAEAAAAEIKNRAQASAGTAQTDADRAAEATREEAAARAEAHVAAVAEASAGLLARIESLDEDLSALLESLRAGATRLARELAAVDADLGELQDAAGTAAARGQADRPAPAADTSLDVAGTETSKPSRATAPEPAAGAVPEPVADAAPEHETAAQNGDLDGARLTALNMALSGEPREKTERYLAENFQVPDREKLIAEVYAAVEG